MCKTKKTKRVTCPDCGKSRDVRADSPARRCLMCTGRHANPFAVEARTVGEYARCQHCGKDYWAVPCERDRGRRHCSAECGNAARRKPDHAEREQARRLAQRALRRGKLVRQPCVACGDWKTHMHHIDYSKPLDIVWLCRDCHTDLHVSLEDLKAKART